MQNGSILSLYCRQNVKQRSHLGSQNPPQKSLMHLGTFLRWVKTCNQIPFMILNVGRDPIAEYKAAHIPGAQFFDINTVADP